MTLDGTVAVIAGGAGDIGAAIGGALAEKGATVVLADLDDERARQLAAEFGPGPVEAVAVDLSEGQQAHEMIDAVAERFGRIDTLVNAAAVTRRGRINEVPSDAWDRLVAVNLSSVYWTCRAAIPHMTATGGGVIVNIGSLAALRALPGSPLYAATKGGVVALSRALAIDHARDGIRVYSVNPPAVDTRLYRRMFEVEDDPEAARRSYEASEGAGRVLSTGEIAALVVFLAERQGPVFSPEPIVW